MKAFFLAFGIHLFCLCIFHVESTPSCDKEGIERIVDLEACGSRACVDRAGLGVASGEGLLPLFISQSQQAVPDLPELARRQVSFRSGRNHDPAPVRDAFQCLEERPYNPGGANFAFIGKQQPVKLRVGGQLAERHIQDDGLSIIKPPNGGGDPNATLVCQYQVQLDNQTGELFSLIRKKSTGNVEADGVAERILRAMRFDPCNQGLVTVGEVEVAFDLGPDQPASSLLKRPS